MTNGYAKASNKDATARLESILLNVEADILSDVARRLKKAGKITSTADWQIDRLNILGNSGDTIRGMLQKATGKTVAEMDAIYSTAAKSHYIRDADLYRVEGRQQMSFEDNLELLQIVRSISDQTNGTIRNITGSTGFMVKGVDGRLHFTSMSNIYDKYLDDKVTEMLTGAKDYATIIRETTRDLTASGLRTIDYASGRSNRVDVAVRRAVLTGYGQLTSRVTFYNAEQLGTDLFEVTWHPNARPEHQAWQGKVYTREQLRTVCGYGNVDGLCGVNCRHVFYPYLPGVSKRQWSDEDLARYNLEENARKEYHGKEYNDYEATQEQRRLETAMRAYKERIIMFETGEADDEDITIAKAKYLAIKKQYKSFSDFFRLPEQWWRVYVNAA